MPLPHNILEQIEGKIEELAQEYQRVQALILTEDDLKCLVYTKLCELEALVSPEQTIDHHIRGTCLHSEVSWYDDNGKLSIKPDLTILETQNLSILHSMNGGLRLPSKQFHFQGNAILIELKFIRLKSGITQPALDAVQKDITKIQALRDRIARQDRHAAEQIFCFFVVFSKSNRGAARINRFIELNSGPPWFKILYKSGNVAFGKRV